MNRSTLKEALLSLFKKPVTTDYPVKMNKTDIPNGHRGLFYPDYDVCTGCTLCSLDCPANAIMMEKLELDRKQNKKGLYPVVDYSKCVFCYHCVYICPVKAYITTNIFELSANAIPNSLAFSLRERKGEDK